jgi:hypothetical protein
MRTEILVFVLIGLLSCNQIDRQDTSNHFTIGSKWTFIEKNSKLDKEYAEIEFKENYSLLVFSELYGRLGPFEYHLKDSVLAFNNINFLIVPEENGSITLKNQNEEFILYKIPFDESVLDSSQFDPFYIRRCYFLTNLGFITTDDAINYLSTIAYQQDSIVEEEIIISN